MSKIFWKDEDRRLLASRGADLKAAGSPLVGLKLLREAQKSLDRGKRRDLKNLGQAPWFEKMLAEEIERRRTVAKIEGELLPIAIGHGELFREHGLLLAESRELLKSLRDVQEGWREIDLEIKQELSEKAGTIVGLLRSLIVEVRALRGPTRRA